MRLRHPSSPPSSGSAQQPAVPLRSRRASVATPLLCSLWSLACVLPGAEPTGNETTSGASESTGAPSSTSSSEGATSETEGESTSGVADTTVGTDTDTPPEHPAIQSMGLGNSSTCVVFADGTTRCWGLDEVTEYELIGDDEPASEGLPFLEGGVVQISSGMNEPANAPSCALRVDGTMSCDEDIDLGVPATQISVGLLHACATLETGAVRCWGFGEAVSGQLGAGNCEGSFDPGCVNSWEDALDIDFGGSAVHVEAGGWSTCVLTDLGTVRCWGENGALGNLHPEENLGDDEVPAVADDVDVGGPVVELVVGARHRCALLDSGAVRCWGENGDGRLGYGHTETIGDDEPPAAAGDIDLGADVVQIAAGENHTCALTTAGSVRCWGDNVYGQLGYADCMATEWGDPSCNVGDDETPAARGDVDVGGTVARIFAGGNHTCALLDTGAIRCWGANNYGQLGYGTCPATGDYDDLTCSIGDDETPASAGDVPIFDE